PGRGRLRVGRRCFARIELEAEKDDVAVRPGRRAPFAGVTGGGREEVARDPETVRMRRLPLLVAVLDRGGSRFGSNQHTEQDFRKPEAAEDLDQNGFTPLAQVRRTSPPYQFSRRSALFFGRICGAALPGPVFRYGPEDKRRRMGWEWPRLESRLQAVFPYADRLKPGLQPKREPCFAGVPPSGG